MATTVQLQYSVTFGKGDSSDWMEWEMELEGEEEAAYLQAMKLRLPLDEVPELEAVLSHAYDEIVEQETAISLECDDEFVQECTGQIPVDPDEINQRVKDRDPYTLDFFGLTDMSEEELDQWDAYDLDDLPNVCDFEEDFEPESPYDSGWTLNVEFAEPPEEDDIQEEEARSTLRELLLAANGDYENVKGYIERCEWSYAGDGEMYQLAEEIAEELGLTDYAEKG